jgi:hypothetical protein
LILRVQRVKENECERCQRVGDFERKWLVETLVVWRRKSWAWIGRRSRRRRR